MAVVEFTVPGVPRPQGSKNQFGGESNPHTRPWRAAITSAAAEHFSEPLKGPVGVKATFVFTRPKSHFGTGRNADKLKPSAPIWATSRLCGDLDKLQRAVGDALTGVALLDDSQISVWATTKSYGEQAHVRIVIEEV